MHDKPKSAPEPAPDPARQAPRPRNERLEREAAALRANLLKRKQQARERQKPQQK